MRKIRARTHGIEFRLVARVTTLEKLSGEWRPELNFLIRACDPHEVAKLNQLRTAGLTNLIQLSRHLKIEEIDGPTVVFQDDGLKEGDVVAIADHMNHAHVLYRPTDQHHTVFLTNQCNSYCLMCSQPPTRTDDSWLIDEALKVAAHIPDVPEVLGFSGGEPLLLGDRLREILDAYTQLPGSTRYEVLSNGRLLANPILAARVLKGLGSRVTWMVPLYGHADFLHDFVVQSAGAFEETLAGLLTLRRFEQSIQLRIVLIRPVLECLPELCEFISRNLPFVREVALMACEPIGFALANPEVTDLDLRDWTGELGKGFKALQRGNIPAILMNAPLCVIPENLWPYAHKSISDWKRKFVEECASCIVRDDCSGLFSWHQPGKQAMKIEKIEGIINV